MTLQEAYQGWQEQEQNRKLFTKTREAFHKAWFQLPTNKPCSYYTKEILGEALAATREVESNKAKAASVMIHVLTFANFAEPGDNPKPKFTYDDLMKFTQALVKPKAKKPQITQKDTDNLLNTDYKDYKETAAEQPQENPSVKSIKSVLNKESAAKPKRIIRKVDDDICQLDPKTLEVVKKWPHALRIKQELGVHNVVRAIERCGQAGGFYWTYSKDLNTFAARLAARQEHNAEVHKNHCAQMRAAKEPQNTQKDTEKKKRRKKPAPVQTTPNPSYSGGEAAAQESPRSSVSSVANKRSAAQAALEVFTDDELFSELERRGWHGYFSRTEIVTIGRK